MVLRLMVPASLMLASACAQSPESAPASAMNFDDCLITHMAAISMLEDAPAEKDANLRAGVIKSQTMLLADDTLDDGALAQRTSTLLQSYGRAAEKAVASAIANGTAREVLAAEAIFCQQELVE